MPNYEFKRLHERRPYGANIVFGHQNKAYNGILKNISLGGAFIATSRANQVCPGDIITLSIPFTSGKKHIKRKGRVNWLNDEGFAVEFL